MVAIYVLYAPAALFISSTIVIRPSRVAITVGILLLIVLNRYQSFRGWIANTNFPTQRSLGLVLQFYNAINPSFMAYRSLAIIFYFISMKGSFGWGDMDRKVPTTDYAISMDWGYMSAWRLKPSFVYNFAAIAVSLLFFFYLAWYYSYRSMGHKACCFWLSSSFWHYKPAVKVEYARLPGVSGRGMDTRDADQITSERNHSIVFSYVTKNFPSCTAVKELKMEILPNQIFTLLGPVALPVSPHA